jgi:hypothetical protein
MLCSLSDGAVAIAANFVNKGAVLCLPSHPNSILLLQLFTMFITIQVY